MVLYLTIQTLFEIDIVSIIIKDGFWDMFLRQSSVCCGKIIRMTVMMLILYIYIYMKLYNDILQYYVLVAKYHTMPVHASPILLHYQRCRSLQMTFPTTRSQPLTDRHSADARALCLVKWSLTFSHISQSQEFCLFESCLVFVGYIRPRPQLLNDLTGFYPMFHPAGAKPKGGELWVDV